MDLPRYDASFPAWMVALILSSMALWTGTELTSSLGFLFVFLFRSLLFCLVLLPNGDAFIKQSGLASGHVAVSFIETVGTIILIYVWLMTALLRGGGLSLLDVVTLLMRGTYGTFRCLGDDGLIALHWSAVRVIFREALTDPLIRDLQVAPSFDELARMATLFIAQFKQATGFELKVEALTVSQNLFTTPSEDGEIISCGAHILQKHFIESFEGGLPYETEIHNL